MLSPSPGSQAGWPLWGLGPPTPRPFTRGLCGHLRRRLLCRCPPWRIQDPRAGAREGTGHLDGHKETGAPCSGWVTSPAPQASQPAPARGIQGTMARRVPCRSQGEVPHFWPGPQAGPPLGSGPPAEPRSSFQKAEKLSASRSRWGGRELPAGGRVETGRRPDAPSGTATGQGRKEVGTAGRARPGPGLAPSKPWWRLGGCGGRRGGAR